MMKWTRRKITDMINDNTIPTGLSARNDKLYYRRLQIVPQEDIDKVLTNLYDDPKYSVNSRDRFYEATKNQYLGISRRRVQEFLSHQEAYQIHLPIKKVKIVAPIITTHTNQRWQIDLIDLSNKNFPFWNDGMKWVLTIVDLFSKYAWAYPLKDKRAYSTAKVIRAHLATNDNPSVIQADNGGEFDAQFSEVLREYKIKFVRSQPYKPHSQGAIEAFNKTLKRRLFHWMSIYKTKTWVDLLPEVLDGYNNTKHSTTGYTPAKIHYEYTNKIVAERIATKGRARMSPAQPLLKVGDRVRVSNWTRKDQRKRKTFDKSYTPNWSLSIFTVSKISKPDIGREQYRLQDGEGKRVNQVYYREELQKIDKVQTATGKRPKRYDNKPLREDQIREQADRRRRGELIVPMRVPEFTALQERAAGARSAAARVTNQLPGDIRNLIGKRVEVFWQRYQMWLPGTVVRYVPLRRQFVVRYDWLVDQGEEDPELYETLTGPRPERWRLLDSEE